MTPKQKILLDYIKKFQKKNGYSPSFEEMKSAMGLKSKSGIHRLIRGLEERGYIEVLPHRARAIEVLKTKKEHAPVDLKTWVVMKIFIESKGLNSEFRNFSSEYEGQL